MSLLGAQGFSLPQRHRDAQRLTKYGFTTEAQRYTEIYLIISERAYIFLLTYGLAYVHQVYLVDITEKLRHPNT